MQRLPYELQDLESLDGLEQAAEYIAAAIKFKKREIAELAVYAKVYDAFDYDWRQWDEPIDTWQWCSFAEVCRRFKFRPPASLVLCYKHVIARRLHEIAKVKTIEDGSWSCMLPPLKAAPNTN